MSQFSISFLVNENSITISCNDVIKVISNDDLKNKAIEVIRADQNSIMNADSDYKYNIYDSFYFRDHFALFLFSDMLDKNIDYIDFDEELEESEIYNQLLDFIISLLEKDSTFII